MCKTWGLIQREAQVAPEQALELFSLRELVATLMSSNPRSEPETAKKPFFLKKVNFWHFEETNNLILVDTSLHWVDTGLFCAGAQQVVGGGIGTATLCTIVMIASGKLEISRN